MTIEHKYLRHKQYGFILWPRNDDVMHAEIAYGFDRRGLISGGFCKVSPFGAECYGRSESTNLASLKEDSELLAAQLGLKP